MPGETQQKDMKNGKNIINKKISKQKNLNSGKGNSIKGHHNKVNFSKSSNENGLKLKRQISRTNHKKTVNDNNVMLKDINQLNTNTTNKLSDEANSIISRIGVLSFNAASRGFNQNFTTDLTDKNHNNRFYHKHRNFFTKDESNRLNSCDGKDSTMTPTIAIEKMLNGVITPHVIVAIELDPSSLNQYLTVNNQKFEKVAYTCGTTQAQSMTAYVRERYKNTYHVIIENVTYKSGKNQISPVAFVHYGVFDNNSNSTFKTYCHAVLHIPTGSIGEETLKQVREFTPKLKVNNKEQDSTLFAISGDFNWTDQIQNNSLIMNIAKDYDNNNNMYPYASVVMNKSGTKAFMQSITTGNVDFNTHIALQPIGTNVLHNVQLKNNNGDEAKGIDHPSFIAQVYHRHHTWYGINTYQEF